MTPLFVFANLIMYLIVFVTDVGDSAMQSY